MKFFNGVVSFLLAIPISFLIFGFSLESQLPRWFTWVISPGLAVDALLTDWFPLHGFNFGYLGTALCTDLMVYTVILYFVLRPFTRRIKPLKSHNFWVQQ